MQKKWRVIYKVINYVLLIIFLLIISNKSSYLGVYRIGIDSRDPTSMYPMLNDGDQIIVIKYSTPDKIAISDLIVYNSDRGEIAHRIVAITIIDNIYYYFTKGDNYNYTSIEAGAIQFKDIIGKVVYVLPTQFGIVISSAANVGYLLISIIIVLIVFFTVISYINTLLLKHYKQYLQRSAWNRKRLLMIIAILSIILLSNVIAMSSVQNRNTERPILGTVYPATSLQYYSNSSGIRTIHYIPISVEVSVHDNILTSFTLIIEGIDNSNASVAKMQIDFPNKISGDFRISTVLYAEDAASIRDIATIKMTLVVHHILYVDSTKWIFVDMP